VSHNSEIVMKRTACFVPLLVVVLLCAGLLLLLQYLEGFSHTEHLLPVPLEEMKQCERAGDCVPVTCLCTCSGCGGFSYQDVVNRNYQEAWYTQNNCPGNFPAMRCPQVCCIPVQITCEDNRCMAREGVNCIGAGCTT